MEELIAQLRHLCAARDISRFSPEEMVELLEEGETIDWIVEQVVPEGPEEVRLELGEVLGQIAAQVAPPPLEPEPEEEAGTAAPPLAPDLELPDLGQLELPPGVDVQQLEQLMASPQGALLADFGTFCQEKGLSPEEADQDRMSTVLRELHEEWLQTPREALEGKKPAEVLEGGRLFPQKVETFRREEPKVGRNDPCPCGSGKKYKKCCGKAA